MKIKNALALTKSTTTKENWKKLTATEASYLAGLIDGEGSLFIAKGRNKQNSKIRITYECVLKICNTHPVIIDLCNKYGGFWLCVDRTTKWKPVYRWGLCAEAQRWYLPQIYPYLKIRNEQAKIMLEALEVMKKQGYRQRWYPDDFKIKMEFFWRELRKLNKTGNPNAILEDGSKCQ